MKRGKWTIVVPDKRIIKQYDEGLVSGIGHVIESDIFWSNNLAPNIRAIQYTGLINDTDSVEYNDGTHNSSFSGDIKIFADEWDKKHLQYLQSIWDNDNIFKNPPDPNEPIEVRREKINAGIYWTPETEVEKINRLGPRPQNYTSSNIY